MFVVAAMLGVSTGSLVQAQNAAVPPDRLTEAILYASFARKAFACEEDNGQDPIAAAEKWTNQAVTVAESIAQDDTLRYGRVREFLRAQREYSAMLNNLDARRKDAPRKVEQSLAKGKLTEAAQMLPAVPIPPCDATFKALFQLVERRQKLFDRFLAEGDSLLGVDSEMALVKYKSAQAIDRDSAVAKERIRQSRGRHP